mmetsp:Transcript_24352/g.37699  ORF Transcript_24352/g.37699 Transcript_24352/m.37699 type:complete len:200 (-) Transcript_24352:508-1107(-)
MPPTPSRSTRLESSALPSPPMRTELRSSDSSRCGSPPTEPLETSLTEPSSESPSLSLTSLALSPDGPSPSSSVDTPMEISTDARMPSSPSPERLSSCSPPKTAASPPARPSTTSREPEPTLECTTLRLLLSPLPDPAWVTLLAVDTLSSSLPRTPFSRSTMDSSRTPSRRSTRKSTRRSSLLLVLITSTDSSMIWSLRL